MKYHKSVVSQMIANLFVVVKLLESDYYFYYLFSSINIVRCSTNALNYSIFSIVLKTIIVLKPFYGYLMIHKVSHDQLNVFS